MYQTVAILVSIVFAVICGDYDFDRFVLHFAMPYSLWSMTDFGMNWKSKDDFIRWAMMVGIYGMGLVSLATGWYQSHTDYYNTCCIVCCVAASVGTASELVGLAEKACKRAT